MFVFPTLKFYLLGIIFGSACVGAAGQSARGHAVRVRPGLRAGVPGHEPHTLLRMSAPGTRGCWCPLPWQRGRGGGTQRPAQFPARSRQAAAVAGGRRREGRPHPPAGREAPSFVPRSFSRCHGTCTRPLISQTTALYFFVLLASQLACVCGLFVNRESLKSGSGTAVVPKVFPPLTQLARGACVGSLLFPPTFP